MSKRIIVVGASEISLKETLANLDVEFVDEVPEDMLIERGPDLDDLSVRAITPPTREGPFQQRSKKAPRKW